MRLRTRLGHLRAPTHGRGDVVPLTVVPRQPPALRTAADVLRLLEETTAVVWADPFTRSAEKARTVARLAAVALKAIEAGNLAARVEMLEAVLKQRHGGGAP